MSYRIYHSALCLLAVTTSLSGCVSRTPHSDRVFGNAVRAAVAAQTLDPSAARNQDPVLGMDGRAGLAAQKSYTQSFAVPEKTSGPMLSDGAK